MYIYTNALEIQSVVWMRTSDLRNITDSHTVFVLDILTGLSKWVLYGDLVPVDKDSEVVKTTVEECQARIQSLNYYLGLMQ